ncbi:hypothetical protein [Yoonia sp. SS1-5]|uniref:OmpP1/FadL family transporter n=1 Tax=Yoonia rhodophyticola TaxID=3137370 RepID=A0AAN0NJ05_9RHOB
MRRIAQTAFFMATITFGGNAFAAGFELGERTLDPLFEEGGYAEISTFSVDVSVSGTAAGFPTGDVGDDFFTGSLALKNDLSSELSYALIIDQPFARDLTYGVGPFAGTEAHLSSLAVTGYLRYKFENRVSVHAGLRAQWLDGVLSDPTTRIRFSDDWGFGYSLGVAYEIPEIALRASLTYDSAIKTEHNTRFNGASVPGLTNTSIETPQSVNLKFQTGVREDTLVFGGIRWTDWDQVTLDPGNGGGPDQFGFRDGLTYTIGVAHVLNDRWTGFAVAEFERKTNLPASSPIDVDDNSRALTLGAQYVAGNATITGSITYVDLYDRNGSIGGAPVSFSDNNAVALGLKVGWSF